MNIKNKKILLCGSSLLPFSSLLAANNVGLTEPNTSGIGKAIYNVLNDSTTANMIKTGAAIGGIYGGYKIFISGESNTLNYILLLGGTALVSVYKAIAQLVVDAFPK